MFKVLASVSQFSMLNYCTSHDIVKLNYLCKTSRGQTSNCFASEELKIIFKYQFADLWNKFKAFKIFTHLGIFIDQSYSYTTKDYLNILCLPYSTEFRDESRSFETEEFGGINLVYVYSTSNMKLKHHGVTSTYIFKDQM